MNLILMNNIVNFMLNSKHMRYEQMHERGLFCIKKVFFSVIFNPCNSNTGTFTNLALFKGVCASRYIYF